MLALSPLVPPPRRRFVHHRGSLFPVRPATSSLRVDAGQDRSFLYPISALASLFTLRVLLCPTARTHTPVWGTSTLREEPRRRAVFVARGFALVATASPSFVLSPLWPSRRHSPTPTRSSPSHLERNQSIQIATTSSLYFTSPPRTSFRWTHERQAKSVHVFVRTYARRRTPRRATVELAAVAKPPTCLRAQVRTWTPPLADQCSLTHARAKASPFCGQTSCEFKQAPPTFSSSPGKPRS
jgi:hypothetical protein